MYSHQVHASNHHNFLLTMKVKLVKQNRTPRAIVHLDYKIHCKIFHNFTLWFMKWMENAEKHINIKHVWQHLNCNLPMAGAKGSFFGWQSHKKKTHNIFNHYKTGLCAQKMWASTSQQVIDYDLRQELECRIKCQCSASLKETYNPITCWTSSHQRPPEWIFWKLNQEIMISASGSSRPQQQP